MIGVLALQGGFAEHLEILKMLGIPAKEVRTKGDFQDITGLIIPGGESTVMAKFIDAYNLRDVICACAQNSDFLIYGTCAGLILLAKDVPSLKAQTLGLLDISVERNAYGRQLASFITPQGAFIRAPKITRVGEGVEIIETHEGSPVLVRQNNIWASTFHPELVGNIEIHRMILLAK